MQMVRQEFTDLSSTYQDRRLNYDKVGVGLDLERQTLEKDCAFFQVRAPLVSEFVRCGASSCVARVA
jgi:hypothetical protein